MAIGIFGSPIYSGQTGNTKTKAKTDVVFDEKFDKNVVERSGTEDKVGSYDGGRTDMEKNMMLIKQHKARMEYAQMQEKQSKETTPVEEKNIHETAVREQFFTDEVCVSGNIAQGFVLRSQYVADTQSVYVEKKDENGNVAAYTIAVDDLDKTSKHPVMQAAAACFEKTTGETLHVSAQENWQKALENFSDYVKDRIENGPPTYAIGSMDISIDKWNEWMDKVDAAIDDIKAEQKKYEEQLEKQRDEKELVKKQAYTERLEKEHTPFDKFSQDGVPYAHLINEDGIIEYKGVVFTCDYEHNAICLGDMSNEADVLSIPLSGGGQLRVNRENLGELAKAIGMFSPEDIRRIMQAIATDNKVKQVQNDIDRTKSFW